MSKISKRCACCTAVRACSGKERLRLATGGAIYGEQREFPAPKNHPQYPLSLYGVSKLAAGRYLYFYSIRHDISYAARRYANVYGLLQDPRGRRPGRRLSSLGTWRRPDLDDSRRRETTLTPETWLGRRFWPSGKIPRTGLQPSRDGHGDQCEELYDRLGQLSEKDLPPVHGPPAPGEQARSAIDPSRAGRIDS